MPPEVNHIRGFLIICWSYPQKLASSNKYKDDEQNELPFSSNSLNINAQY